MKCSEGQEPVGDGKGCVNWEGVIIAGVALGGGILLFCGLILFLQYIGRSQSDNANIQQEIANIRQQRQRRLRQQTSGFNQLVRLFESFNLKVLEMKTLNYLWVPR